MEKHGVDVEVIRRIDQDIATGTYPDTRDYGWMSDAWPAIYERVRQADILVLVGNIWLGDHGSETTAIVERLCACSSQFNQAGQDGFYGKVGGCLITGNDDGIRYCAIDILYSLQHLGFAIPPQVDAGWIGEAGLGPSDGDQLADGTREGLDNDFTNGNVTCMTWNVMHVARMLRGAVGIPAYSNQRSEWEDGARFDFANPDYR